MSTTTAHRAILMLTTTQKKICHSISTTDMKQRACIHIQNSEMNKKKSAGLLKIDDHVNGWKINDCTHINLCCNRGAHTHTHTSTERQRQLSEWEHGVAETFYLDPYTKILTYFKRSTLCHCTCRWNPGSSARQIERGEELHIWHCMWMPCQVKRSTNNKNFL